MAYQPNEHDSMCTCWVDEEEDDKSNTINLWTKQSNLNLVTSVLIRSYLHPLKSLARSPVPLNLSARLIIYSIIFFSHNKTVSVGLSTAKTIS